MFKDVIGRFGPPPSNNLLVDIGASSGFFVEFAAAQGWNAVGIEIGASLAAIGRDLGRNLVVGDAEEIPLRSGSAAVVTLWDVLDQFDRPGRAIQEMARVLRPGGLLWLRVRHGAIHEFMRSQSWLPTQLSVIQSNLLSPRCLTHALTHAGFDDIRVGVAASSSGDPYASVRPGTQARLLQFAKRSWDAAAMVGAFVSAGSLVISPSITVLARREDTPVATE
jgi:SAM-dependent methyltransferase